MENNILFYKKNNFSGKINNKPPSDELEEGERYIIFIKGHEVGSFGVVQIGKIPIDPANYIKNADHNKVYNNSLTFGGGFQIKKKKYNQGIGRLTIQTIFKNNPWLENIFLYALGDQGAIGFWKKIGGKIIAAQSGDIDEISLNPSFEDDPINIKYRDKGIVYIQLNRHNV